MQIRTSVVVYGISKPIFHSFRLAQICTSVVEVMERGFDYGSFRLAQICTSVVGQS